MTLSFTKRKRSSQCGTQDCHAVPLPDEHVDVARVCSGSMRAGARAGIDASARRYGQRRERSAASNRVCGMRERHTRIATHRRLMLRQHGHEARRCTSTGWRAWQRSGRRALLPTVSRFGMDTAVSAAHV